MKNLTIIGLSAALATAACGDNATGNSDASTFPPAPTLGAAIDRMGRPAINTALNGVLDDDKKAKKDAYNQATSQDSWASVPLPDPDPTRANNTIQTEFQRYLGIYDALDTGEDGVVGAGCGNTALYNGGSATDKDPKADSYTLAAAVLADDELYVDTALGACDFYLALEVEVATNMPHNQCGGRTLQRDVIDASYSLLAAGLNGFDTTKSPPEPKVHDGASAHGDYLSEFPYLGAPHAL